MIELEKTVFLLDGQTEILSFRKRFEADFGVRPELRKVGCNGKSVTPEGYSNAAYGTLLVALSSYFTSIVCILDRERRKMSAAVLSQQIKMAIVDRIKSSTQYSEDELNNKIHVCVPDIMFENWIVSDVDSIKKQKDLVGQDAEMGYYDGTSGAKILNGMMKAPYKKTMHAPKLFNCTKFSVSKVYSPSFKDFASVLGV